MAIHLTAEQERRVHAVMSRGAYESVEEVMDAALAAIEQRTVPGFAGTQEELDALLAEGLASKELAEDEVWGSVNAQTNACLPSIKRTRVREGFVIHYLLDEDIIRVIRILHGKRDVKRILEREGDPKA